MGVEGQKAVGQLWWMAPAAWGGMCCREARGRHEGETHSPPVPPHLAATISTTTALGLIGVLGQQAKFRGASGNQRGNPEQEGLMGVDKRRI